MLHGPAEGGLVRDPHAMDKRIGPGRRDKRSNSPRPSLRGDGPTFRTEPGDAPSATQPAKGPSTIFMPWISALEPTDATIDPNRIDAPAGAKRSGARSSQPDPPSALDSGLAPLLIPTDKRIAALSSDLEPRVARRDEGAGPPDCG